MELHTVHHHVFDATHEAGAVGLGQSTGHRQLLQTTWGDVDSNENEISEGGSRRWFLGQSYLSWELQTTHYFQTLSWVIPIKVLTRAPWNALWIPSQDKRLGLGLITQSRQVFRPGNARLLLKQLLVFRRAVVWDVSPTVRKATNRTGWLPSLRKRPDQRGTQPSQQPQQVSRDDRRGFLNFAEKCNQNWPTHERLWAGVKLGGIPIELSSVPGFVIAILFFECYHYRWL